MRRIIFPSVIAALLLAVGPMPDAGAESLSGGVQRVNSGANPVTSGSNQMGFDLMKRLDDGHKTNIVISPYSISTALWLVTGGARGTTGDELRSALHYKGSADAVPGFLKSVATSLKTQSKDVSLKIANGLFVQKSYPLLPQYVSTARTVFDGTVAPVNFTDGSGENVINTWVDKNTNGKIKTIVKNLPPSTRLVVANAVYFKAPWEEEFAEYLTQPQPFTTPTAKVSVPFMNKEEDMIHAKNSACEILVLPYKSPSTCEMVFLLPAANSSVTALLAALPSSFTQWRQSAKFEYGVAAVPKFKTTYDASLVPAFSAMGVKSAFSGATADFSGITANKKEPLFISGILHKTYLDVNEKGTEAAAVTAIAMAGAGAPVERKPAFTMKIDRPFVLAIADSKTNTILFVGAIYNPVAK